MKKFIFLSVIIINLLFSLKILAQESKSPVYFQFSTGLAINNGKQEDSGIASVGSVKHGNVQTFSAVLGYVYSPNVRFSVSLDYLPEWRTSSSNNISGISTYYETELSSLATRLNIYYDFTELGNAVIVPYVTTGVGASINRVGSVEAFTDSEFSRASFTNSKTNFTWNLGTGISYRVSSNLILDSSYNYTRLGSVSTKSGYYQNFVSTPSSSDKISYKSLYSHRIMLGIRVSL